jgi:hypothetical protein
MTDFPARPTIYNGILMRSRTEARFAGALDAIGVSWQYEPMCYASGRTQYLPDFRVDAPCGPLFIEVKGQRPSYRLLMDRMRVVRASVPDAYLATTCPGWRGFMVVSVPGLTYLVVAHWARWSHRGITDWGPFPVGTLGMAAHCLADGRNDFAGHRIEVGPGAWVEFQTFDWEWDGDDAAAAA